MTEDQYKKLNNYLNDIFLYLEKRDYVLIENINWIGGLNEKFIKFIKNYSLENKVEENTLTFDDVYLLAREIIENINKNYLENFNNLIETGQLDFSYNNDYFDSHYMNENGQDIININRMFNYGDVILLIHEFIHYTNNKEKCSINRYLLTEFLSIYFEIYSINFLIDNKNISKNEIDYFDRLKNTQNQSNRFSWYESVLLAYEKFGNIDKNSIKLLKENYLNIEEEQFNKECLIALDNFERFEKKYNKKIKYEKEFNLDVLNSELCVYFSMNYRYIIGTILAFYANKYCKLEDIVYLNDHINDEKYAHMNLYEVLLSIGIDLNSEHFKENTFIGMEEFINNYDNNLKK